MRGAEEGKELWLDSAQDKKGVIVEAHVFLTLLRQGSVVLPLEGAPDSLVPT